MKYSVERKDEFQILSVSRVFHAPEALKEIPAFWDEYYRLGYGDVACGQFAYCYDEKPDCTFRYAIGNHCTVGKDGIFHIFNCPDRKSIPDGFELLTVPARTWLKVECIGPLPQSIQGMHPVIQREFPSEWERVGGCEIEEYGYCTCPEDSQKPDYKCYIWIPVREKKYMEIISLREKPELLEKFVEYFSCHWGKPGVYRDCMASAVSAASSLPQWFLAVTPEQKIIGCVGLITNDFISRMDLFPWLCALYVEEEYRCQGIGAKLISAVADCAERNGFSEIFCCTDHSSYYERYDFEYVGIGYHPWGETSRIYRKKLHKGMNVRDQFNRLADKYDVSRRQIVPCFDDFYIGATAAASRLAGQPQNILELGAGTGLLTKFWLWQCPKTNYLLTDFADEMLNVARKRFEGLANVSYMVLDYAAILPSGAFDSVISALSIHHLDDARKADLFQRIFDLLPDNGWFFNYDLFRSSDNALNLIQEELWYGRICSGGMTDEDIASWKERKKLDRECSVETEISMLRESGFAMVECIFLSGKFAVIAAQKRKKNSR